MEGGDPQETRICSNCKREILKTNYEIHSIHCLRNIILCSKCNEPIRREEVAEHNNDQHTLVFCTSCNKKVEKCDLEAHSQDECPNRKVKCQICCMEVAAADVGEHENYCGARTEKCAECGEFVMLKYQKLHLDSNHAFLKLTDEPGPSAAWQRGRRTLGNFLPDLSTAPISVDTMAAQGSSLQSKDCSTYTGALKKTSNNPNRKSPKVQDPNVNFNKSQVPDKNSVKQPIKPGKDKKEVLKFPTKARHQVSTRREQENVVQQEERQKAIQDSLLAFTFQEDEKQKELNIETKLAQDKKQKEQEIQDSLLALALQEDEKQKELDIETSLLAFKLAEDEKQEKHDLLLAQQLGSDEHPSSPAQLLNSFGLPASPSMETFLGSFFETDVDQPNVFPYQRVSLPSRNNFNDDDDDFLIYDRSEIVSLPCEICGSMIPSEDLILHQTGCELTATKTTTDKRTDLAPVSNIVEIPCEFCSQMFPTFRLNSHQLLCTLNNMRPEARRIQNNVDPPTPDILHKIDNTSSSVRELKHMNNRHREGLRNGIDESPSRALGLGTRTELLGASGARPRPRHQKNRRAPSPPSPDTH